MITSRMFAGDKGLLSIVGLGGFSYSLRSSNNAIVVPFDVIGDALEKRMNLTLKINNQDVIGYIYFLPRVESEPFPINGRLGTSGQVIEATGFRLTDFVPMDGVREMVISASGNASQIMCAYDENQEFIKVILEPGSYVSEHVVYDGSYAFIRAAGNTTSPRELMLYFRDRRG